MSSLYEEWISTSRGQDGLPAEKYWKAYMPREQEIYASFLGKKENTIKTTVADFAKEHELQTFEAVGFFDGISEALDSEIDVENMEEDTAVDVSFKFENLFKKMVEYKAKHLYLMPAWNDVIEPDRQKELVKEQQKSGIVVKDKKIGRNDPCPCASGKKYKKCCGLDD